MGTRMTAIVVNQSAHAHEVAPHPEDQEVMLAEAIMAGEVVVEAIMMITDVRTVTGTMRRTRQDTMKVENIRGNNQ